jgi:phospholipid-transporting ATPase
MSNASNQKKNKIRVYFGENNNYLRHNLTYSETRIEKTSYNLITYLPHALLLHFRLPVYSYFLTISIFSLLPFSVESPGLNLGVVSFLIIVSVILEVIHYNHLITNYMKEDNKKLVRKFIKGQWCRVEYRSLRPGDFVEINTDEEICSDLLLIVCNNDDGKCYIDKKNLNGETGFKEKSCVKELKDFSINDLRNLEGVIECDYSLDNFNLWEAYINFNFNDVSYNCKGALNNLILKGSVLKFTTSIVGVVIYTEYSNHIIKNKYKPHGKVSKIFKKMEVLIYMLISFNMALSLMFTFFSYLWMNSNGNEFYNIFIKKSFSSKKETFIFAEIFLQFLNKFSISVPICIYISLDILRKIQVIIISNDSEKNIYLQNNRFNYNRNLESLGQVDIIFTDKTGTLTQNKMEMKKIFVNGQEYGGDGNTLSANEIFQLEEYGTPVEKIKKIEELERKERFFISICLCHKLLPISNENIIEYKGESMDEIALVKGAQRLGFEYRSREYNELNIFNYLSNTKNQFEHILDLPFDSERKMMSVVYFNQKTNKLNIISKGAFQSMKNVLDVKPKILENLTKINRRYSKEGLRVIILGGKEIERDWFEDWLQKYKNVNDDPHELYKLHSEIEKELDLIGCAGIEDILQKDVVQTITSIINCNVKIFMVTGDDVEIATCISRSTKLVGDYCQFEYFCMDEESIYDKINKFFNKYKIDIVSQAITSEEINEKYREKEKMEFALVIDGVTIEDIMAQKELKSIFFILLMSANTVIFCRMTPASKAKVVSLIKDNSKYITLAIGDGINDIPMLKTANIGIGIYGRRNYEAALTADIAIGQFSYLEKLLLSHGRLSYVKISKTICFYFYKNLLLLMMELPFSITNGFSTQSFFPEYFPILYDLVFSSWASLFIFSVEKDVDLRSVKRYPFLYQPGKLGYYFNFREIIYFVSYSAFHSLCCFFISSLTFKYSILDGKQYEHWYVSITCLCIIVNLLVIRIFLQSEYWNYMNIFVGNGNLLLFYLILFIFNLKGIHNELSGIFLDCLLNPVWWVVNVFVTLLIALPDITLKQLNTISCPSPTQAIMNKELTLNELKKEANGKKEKDEIPLQRKISHRITKGIGLEQEKKKVDYNLNTVEADSFLVLKENITNPNINIISNKIDGSVTITKMDKDGSIYASKNNPSPIHVSDHIQSSERINTSEINKASATNKKKNFIDIEEDQGEKLISYGSRRIVNFDDKLATSRKNREEEFNYGLTLFQIDENNVANTNSNVYDSIKLKIKKTHKQALTVYSHQNEKANRFKLFSTIKQDDKNRKIYTNSNKLIVHKLHLDSYVTDNKYFSDQTFAKDKDFLNKIDAETNLKQNNIL